MNQILSFKITENGRKILKNNTKHLCMFLIIFSIILIGEGAWRLYTNLNKNVDIIKPEIIGTIKSDKTVFNVKSEIGIKEIVYSWNGWVETRIDKSGENNFNFDVENPIGVNELLIKTTDVNGGTVTYNNIKIVYDEDDGLGAPEDDSQTGLIDWETAVANDKKEPMVVLTAEKGKVVITASDDVMMSYITYSWNGGEEVKVTGLSEDEKTLSTKVDALKGDNKIKIKAYDKAGNCKELEKDVHGTDGPKISVKKNDGKLIINVTDEYSITKIEYNFNNEEKSIENIEGNNYEFTLDLKDGDNFIIINAYEGNVKSEYKGKTKK